NQATWEQYVRLTLGLLYEITGSRAGPIVLKAIMRAPRRCVIRPIMQIWENAEADADNLEDATPKGKPVRDGKGKIKPERGLGTGNGSDFHVPFDAMDWWGPHQAPGLFADEVLLHELVHGLRMTRGQSDPIPFNPGPKQRYGTTEEFDAVVVSNIYRS